MDYTTIKDLAQSFTNRYDADVTANMDNFIGLAEARMARMFRQRKMVKNFEQYLDGSPEYALPLDFREMVEVHCKDVDGKVKRLNRRNTDQMFRIEHENLTFVDQRTGFYVIEGEFVRIAPATGIPDATIDLSWRINMGYYQDIPGLTSSNTTNWLGDTYPDVYVSAICVEIYRFVKDYDSVNEWMLKLNEDIDSMAAEAYREEWHGQPMFSRPDIYDADR